MTHRTLRGLAATLFFALLAAAAHAHEGHDRGVHHGGEAADAAELRVMSFNIRFGTADDGPDRWERRAPRTIEMIRRHDPDVLGLQEAMPFQAEQLLAALPAYAAAGVGGRGEGDPYAGGGQDIPILFRKGRFELLEDGRFWLSETPGERSKSWDSSMVRAAHWARLRDVAAGRELLVVNTHFDHRGEVSRREAAGVIRRKIDELSGGAMPVVVTGDFNTSEDSEPYEVLVGDTGRPPLIDSYRAAGGLPEGHARTYTFNGFRDEWNGRKGRIDWVLHSPELRVVKAGTDRDRIEGRYPSDHFPVHATLAWADAPATRPATRAADAGPTTRAADGGAAESDGAADGRRPKNVIVLIADGAGYNTLDATRFWTGRPLAVDADGWRESAVAPFALRGDDGPAEGHAPAEQAEDFRYDPARNYDARPAFGVRPGAGEVAGRVYPRGFAGYEWNRDFRPDSANTMTALMTGVATYPGAINVGGDGRPLPTLAEAADAAGMRVGVVTSVPFNHATPAAAAGAHNASRSNYHALAEEMLFSGTADVIAGPTNPDYDEAGRRRDEPDHKFLPADLWSALKLGTLADDSGRPWTLVQDTRAIADLAAGETPEKLLPEKLLIVPKVYRTLQQKRPAAGDARLAAPGEDSPLPGLPTLAELTLAALNAVDDDEDGFFLMVEGGAVDWAMHDNQLGRMIEEYEDFDAAVTAIVAYLDAGTSGHSWADTLVIVTADHDHLLFGPDGDAAAYQPVEDRGPGVLPGHRWLFDHHSNQLVPLFARGPGAAEAVALADLVDAAEFDGAAVGRGPYMHQAVLGGWLMSLVGDDAQPAPATRPATAG